MRLALWYVWPYTTLMSFYTRAASWRGVSEAVFTSLASCLGSQDISKALCFSEFSWFFNANLLDRTRHWDLPLDGTIGSRLVKIPNLKLTILRRSAALKLGTIPGIGFQIIGLANKVFSTSLSLLTT
jgi:hypothetical protein